MNLNASEARKISIAKIEQLDKEKQDRQKLREAAQKEAYEQGVLLSKQQLPIIYKLILKAANEGRTQVIYEYYNLEDSLSRGDYDLSFISGLNAALRTELELNEYSVKDRMKRESYDPKEQAGPVLYPYPFDYFILKLDIEW